MGQQSLDSASGSADYEPFDRIDRGMRMSFRSVTGDDQGNFYAISNDGDLFYYRDEARNGSARWAFDGVGQKIGNGWGDIRRVFSGGDGILYAITSDGHLLFFRDEARDGSERWAFGGTGQDLGRAKTPDDADAGWLSFWTVFSGGDGVIYAITFDGDLLYFKDLARDGRNAWAGAGGSTNPAPGGVTSCRSSRVAMVSSMPSTRAARSSITATRPGMAPFAGPSTRLVRRSARVGAGSGRRSPAATGSSMRLRRRGPCSITATSRATAGSAGLSRAVARSSGTAGTPLSSRATAGPSRPFRARRSIFILRRPRVAKWTICGSTPNRTTPWEVLWGRL